MTDDITVSRELLRQVLEALENAVSDDQPYLMACNWSVTALRAALEQAPVQEQQPVAWASQTAIDIAAEGGEGIIVGAEADCLIPLYAVPQPAPAERTVQEPVCRGCGIPINDIHMSTCPTKKWPMYVTPADAAQPEPVQEQQFTADELDLMRQWFESMQDTNRSFVIDADKKLHQKIIAAIQAAPRAEQPRKAVKLSDSEILAALEVEYVSSAQNRHLFLSDARTIEAAVWAKLGVEP